MYTVSFLHRCTPPRGCHKTFLERDDEVDLDIRCVCATNPQVIFLLPPYDTQHKRDRTASAPFIVTGLHGPPHRLPCVQLIYVNAWLYIVPVILKKRRAFANGTTLQPEETSKLSPSRRSAY